MIQTECKGCGQKLKVPDDMAGKRARCPSCGDPVKVPGASAAASSPERPPPATPPPGPRPAPPAPRRPTPAPVAQPAPPASSNPFEFVNPSTPPAVPPTRTPAPVAQLAPQADVSLVFPEPETTTARPSARVPSLPRRLASYGAVLGAVLGVTLFLLIGPSDEKIGEAIGRMARGKITADHVRGALVGLISGVLVGSAVIAVVGRSLHSVVVGCLLVIAGTVFGTIRQAADGQLPPFLLAGAAVCGVVVGAALGGLIGAIASLSRS